MCWLEAGRGGSIVGNRSCLAMKILNTTRKSILRLNSEKKRYQQSIKYKKGKRKYKKEINSCHRELPGDKNIEYNPKKNFGKQPLEPMILQRFLVLEPLELLSLPGDENIKYDPKSIAYRTKRVQQGFLKDLY